MILTVRPVGRLSAKGSQNVTATGKNNITEELNKASAVTSLLMPDTLKRLEAVNILLMVILSWWITPLQMLFRVAHGERALSPLRLFNTFMALRAFWFMSMLASWFVVAFMSQAGIRVQPVIVSVSPVLGVAFLGAGVFHLWRISVRRRRKEIWHSKSLGISLLEVWGVMEWVNARLAGVRIADRWAIPFRVDRWLIYNYIEPLMGALLAYIVGWVDPVTSTYLWISSGALFIHNQRMTTYQHHQLLDLWDSQIEAENLQDAACGAPPAEIGGIMAIPGLAHAFRPGGSLDIAGRVGGTMAAVNGDAPAPHPVSPNQMHLFDDETGPSPSSDGYNEP